MKRLLGRARLLAGRDLALGTLMERLAVVHGDRPLVSESGGLELTHRQAAARVARWAGGIDARITVGDRVVVALPNGYHFLLACLAVSRAGGVPVPVNPRMSQDEVDHVVGDAGAGWVIRAAGELDDAAAGTAPLAEAAPVDPGAVAALFYTSGTTGKPKGARLTHRALLGQVGSAALWPAGIRRDEAVLALPVAHIMGFAALLGLAVAGIPVRLLARFDADAVLDAIEQRRATMFIGVPAMYRMMLDAGAEGRDLASVRVWASGADVMPPELAKRFKAMGATVTLPGIGLNVGEATFVEGYGMVELGGGAAARISPPGLQWPFGEDALGVALPGYHLKVVDDDGHEVRAGVVGELLVKGPGVLEGYHGDPDATAAALTDDGWLRTGDLARKGALGMVSFAGRKKDVIKQSGFSVFAVEVERALEAHPDVVEAAVLGLPDERAGEVPVAVVRLRPGGEVTGAELVAWAKGAMSSYKAPRRVLVVDELPRTGTTKVQKRELLDLF
ncbi:MAG TPA: AMP-binding protein [Acidimicrobiales bacterium]|nr:AMP-binding protein [Acidimicrobiales bacterium]